jgi:hypothetical protein
LRHALDRAARADPTRRFHALFDKVSRSEVLDRAWEQVRRNRGAAGIDHITLADVEESGVARLLGELAADLREWRYRPLPARRVFLPKPGGSEQRPLSIPTVRDRVVQAALRIVLEPIFEADVLDRSFGFGPRRSAHGALRVLIEQVLVDESWRGRRWWWRPTSPTVLRRFHTPGCCRRSRNASATGRAQLGAHAAARRGDAGRGAATQQGWHPAGRGADSSHAVGNFEFEVSLPYRRVELPRRPV